jgi:prophage regulatory protein
MGSGEIRERLGGLSRQRVYQITTDPSFPAPYDQLLIGKVWRVEDVEAWIRDHYKPRGRAGSPGNQSG